MDDTITIEYKLDIPALKENNSREVLLEFIREELYRHELTTPITHERR